ncbi:hypothetical protein FISHEDRAFT_68331 [Fistulina hepatica ATCC 64428]|uniref:DNA-directed DNA polymerase n=1 Tax=Fistulina hepatica ATCC 64428 TaxID=1128425 RepID=A0A0D7AT19_9AGAR|nr:hypothetical protein FISHEDRAFT_68331 [Fistulina hepatica ATCC 64428]
MPILPMKHFCYDTAIGGVVKVGKLILFGPELDIHQTPCLPLRHEFHRRIIDFSGLCIIMVSLPLVTTTRSMFCTHRDSLLVASPREVDPYRRCVHVGRDQFKIDADDSWCAYLPRNKTLNGGRTERNDYILLHEFHQLECICLDKWGKKYTPGASKKGKNVNKEKQKGKEAYKSGLVLPQRGLWDKITLVMGFNSFFPSNMQAYNIDSDCGDRRALTDAVDEQQGQLWNPEPPSPDVPQGGLL